MPFRALSSEALMYGKTWHMVALSGACAIACSGDRGATPAYTIRDSAGIRVIEIESIDATTAPRTASLDEAWNPAAGLELGELVDIGVSETGATFLLDRLAAEVIVIPPNASAPLRFGRQGDGPGEFSPRGLSSLVMTDTSVLVPDLVQQRITEFDHNGQLIATRAYPSPGYAVDWRSHHLGGVVYRIHSDDGGALIHWNGEKSDTLAVFEPTDQLPNTILPPVPIWDVDASGDLILGRTDRPRVEKQSADARWVALLPLPTRAVGVTERDQLEAAVMESLRRRNPGAVSTDLLAQVQYPETLPQLAAVKAAPDGEIWVRLAAEVAELGRDALRVASAVGYGGSSWLVLRPDGTLDRLVTFDQDFTPRVITTEWIYGVHTDDLGVSWPARVQREST